MINCPTCTHQKAYSEWLDTENVFITSEQEATCRQCGTMFPFTYDSLPSERQIKEAIYEAVDQNLGQISSLKKQFFFHEDKSFATYFNICQFLKYGAPEAVNSDALPPYVVTLWQPWAQLYAAGLKRLETRPRAISARGTILIHAAKKFDPDQREICRTEPFRTALESIGYNVDNLPLGAIVGAVDITKTVKVIDPSIARTYANELSLGLVMVPPEGPEYSFGDYRPNRFVWHGQNHRLLKEPVPYANGQGYYLRYRNDLSQLKFQ